MEQLCAQIFLGKKSIKPFMSETPKLNIFLWQDCVYRRTGINIVTRAMISKTDMCQNH